MVVSICAWNDEENVYELIREALEEFNEWGNPNEHWSAITVNFNWQAEFSIDETHLTPAVRELIETYKIRTTIITCMFDQEQLEEKVNSIWGNAMPKELVTVVAWWDYYLLHTVSELELPDLDSFYQTERVDQGKFSSSYLCYMHKPKLHRNLLIDELAKHKLIDRGNVTYHYDIWNEGGDANYEFKHYNGVPIHNDHYVNNDSWHRCHPYSVDEEFMSSFLHVVTESDVISTVLSEKTAMPIFLKRPFLILGTEGHYRRLQEKGFVLYDEIFDYSFDSEPDIGKRVELITKNIQNVVDNRDKLEEWFDILKPKLDHNYNIAQESLNAANFPEAVLDRIYCYTRTWPRFTEQRDARIFYKKVEKGIYPTHLSFDLNNDIYAGEIIEQAAEYMKIPKVYYFGYTEWCPIIPKPMVDAVNNNNIELNSCWLSCDSKWLSEQVTMQGVRKHNTQAWPTYFMLRTIEYERENITNNFKNTENITKDFSHNYINLNMQPHQHRCMLIDMLAKYGLVDHPNGLVSWHNHAASLYEFRWYDDKIRTIGDDFENHKDSFNLPDQYYTSFVDIITESTTEVPVITEKTAQALFMKKPFIVLGSPCFSKDALTHYGFKLYDELFDYSFDEEKDDNLRAVGVAMEVKKISKMTPKECNDMYEILKPKLEYNKALLIKLAYSTDYMPEMLLNNYIKFSDPENPRYLGRNLSYDFVDIKNWTYKP